MKKTLLATTALISVAYAGSALAQESMVMGPQGADASFGGFYEFRYSSFGDDDERVRDETKTTGDSELFVSFSRVADNGVEYSMDAQLEVVNGGKSNPNAAGERDVDEAWITLDGDFGRLQLGNNDHASDAYQVWIGAAGSYGQDDVTTEPGFVHTLRADDGTDTGDEIEADMWFTPALVAVYNDASKISYFSPNLSGFDFGLTIADVDGLDEFDQSWGVEYSANAMGYADVVLKAASVTRYTGSGTGNTAENPGEIVETSYGVEVTYDDLTVIASVGDHETTAGNTTVGTTSSHEVTAFGVGYDVSNDFDVAFFYADAENADKKQSGEYTSISGTYIIAPGLSLALAYNTFELTDARGGFAYTEDGGRETTADDAATNEGDEIILELEVSF